MWVALLIILMVTVSIIVLFVGQKLCASSPSKVNKPATQHTLENVTLTKPTGEPLHAWWLPGDASSPIILHFHGNRQSRLQMMQRAEFFAKHGYNNLLPDFQAHGESGGKYVTFGHREAEDAELWFHFIKDKYPEHKVVAIALSLGGAACLLGKTAHQLDALVLEMVYPTLNDAINNRMALRFGRFSRFITPLLTVQLKPTLGIWPKDLEPIEHIKTVSTPMLLIAGSDDDRTTLEESQRLYDAAAEPKEFLVIEGAKHEDLHAFAKDIYEQRVLSFIQKHT